MQYLYTRGDPRLSSTARAGDSALYVVSVADFVAGDGDRRHRRDYAEHVDHAGSDRHPDITLAVAASAAHESDRITEYAPLIRFYNYGRHPI